MHPLHAQKLATQRQKQIVLDAQERRRARKNMSVDDLRVRFIDHGDRERLIGLFSRLSPRSTQLRFFSPVRQLTDAQLSRLIDIDHECHEALVALSGDAIVAEARYDGECGSGEAEIALTVDDAWQRRGVGTSLARRLMALAAQRGFNRFVANILPENRAALGLVRELGPDVSVRWDSGAYVATIPLARAS
jgi:GNAT superfamily N-acetyltransferase